MQGDKTMKRLLALLLLVMLATQGLFALGQEEAPEAGVTTITWWHYGSGLAGKAVDSIVQEFNETVGKEKQIQVNAVFQGRPTMF